MSWDVSRRVFLRGAGLAAVGVGMAPSSLLVRTAQAASGAKVLVKVFLRGGADGLNLCAPYGDSEYYNLRGGIALPRPGQAGGVVNLDGYFGMHPEFAPLEPFFRDGRLAFVHAVGNPELSRSHFDAQDFQESGTPGDKQTPTGWLDRAIAQIPGKEVTQAVSFSSQLVRSYLGPEPVLVAQTLSSFDLRARNWRAEAETLLTSMYQADPSQIGTTGLETFEAINTLLRAPTPPPSNGASYPNGNTGNALRQAAGLIKNGVGTRTVYVNVSGAFDTHSNQLNGNTNDYRPLGQALAAFATDLGGLLDDVVLMVTTEFGRTARVNGAAGTDHGTGYAMLVLGGRVRGGRVLGRWPGLSSSQLYQNRDLAATTDFRDVFQEVARAQFGISASLFPGYTPAAGVGVV
ncbi:MAG: DUF1501 domain-containing protein [Vicinamibacterales bacterium]|jgi:uncharacterized protein (DUF1501 family)